MSLLLAGIKKFVGDAEGATMIEYALMIGLIAFVGYLAVQLLGSNTVPIFQNAANGFAS